MSLENEISKLFNYIRVKANDNKHMIVQTYHRPNMNFLTHCFVRVVKREQIFPGFKKEGDRQFNYEQASAVSYDDPPNFVGSKKSQVRL